MWRSVNRGRKCLKYVVHGEVVGGPSLLNTAVAGTRRPSWETGNDNRPKAGEREREETWIFPCFV